MELGTHIYFDLGEKRPVEEVVGRVYSLTLAQLGLGKFKQKEDLVRHHVRGADMQFFSSIETWRSHLSDCGSVELYIESSESPKCYKLFAKDVEKGRVGVVLLVTSSALWMPALDIRFSADQSALEDSISDYRLCKRLYRELAAERCLGSCQGNYYEMSDPCADEAFLFTRQGPQKLVGLLEEGRVPRWGEKQGGPSDFVDDPLTGLPSWVWLVDKPFSAIASS